MTTLYTLGYQQRSFDEFVGILQTERIDVLVDVRETAWSHKAGFCKSALSHALDTAGIDYVHAPFAGNPKWLRSQATSHRECLDWYAWYLGEFTEIGDALESLIGAHTRHGRRICLMCFERHADDCHRSILADDWAGRGRRRVVHLAVQGCARLVS